MIPRQFLIGAAVMLLAIIGMGLYLRQMKNRALELERAVSDSRPVAPPASGPTEQVTLYIADDGTGTVHAIGSSIPLPSGRQQRAEELLRALMNMYLGHGSTHVLPVGAEIRSVYLIDPGVAVIDVNTVFADNHRSGVLVEELTVLSMIQTLSANIPNITRVRILVDGKQRETLAGHADLTSFYDISGVSQLVSQLQSQQ